MSGSSAARERRAQSHCHHPAARDRAVIGLQVPARDRSGRLATKHRGLAWRELAHPSPRVRAFISAAVIRAGQLRLRTFQIRHQAELLTLSADPSAAERRAGSGSRRAAGSGGSRACRQRWRRSWCWRDRGRHEPMSELPEPVFSHIRHDSSSKWTGARSLVPRDRGGHL